MVKFEEYNIVLRCPENCAADALRSLVKIVAAAGGAVTFKEATAAPQPVCTEDINVAVAKEEETYLDACGPDSEYGVGKVVLAATEIPVEKYIMGSITPFEFVRIHCELVSKLDKFSVERKYRLKTADGCQTHIVFPVAWAVKGKLRVRARTFNRDGDWLLVDLPRKTACGAESMWVKDYEVEPLWPPKFGQSGSI